MLFTYSCLFQYVKENHAACSNLSDAGTSVSGLQFLLSRIANSEDIILPKFAIPPPLAAAANVSLDTL